MQSKLKKNLKIYDISILIIELYFKSNKYNEIKKLKIKLHFEINIFDFILNDNFNYILLLIILIAL